MQAGGCFPSWGFFFFFFLYLWLFFSNFDKSSSIMKVPVAAVGE